MYRMSDHILQHAVALRGDAGRRWVESIPRMIEVYQERWSIRVGRPFDLNYNYVAPATKSDGTPVVLKVGLNFGGEFVAEIEALQYFDGRGAARLLAADLDNAVALLEMVEPGTTLDQLNDDEKETRIASRIARTLWRPIPSGSHSLATLQKWYAAFQEHRKRFGGGSGPLPAAIFDKGEALFRQLLQTAETPTLIHGDFHHGNILSSQRDGWLTIDPKGVIGDPIYDLAVFLRNPPPALFSGLITRALLERRIEIFSQELGFDKERIAQWGMAQAVLSAVWSVEESGKGWEQTIAAAELLELLAGKWAWL